MPIRTPVNVQPSSSYYSLAPSSIEDIDYALYKFCNDEIKYFRRHKQGIGKSPSSVFFA